MVLMSMIPSTKIVKLITPYGGTNMDSENVRNVLLYCHIYLRISKCMKPSTKIVKFMVTWLGPQVLRWSHYGEKVKMFF